MSIDQTAVELVIRAQFESNVKQAVDDMVKIVSSGTNSIGKMLTDEFSKSAQLEGTTHDVGVELMSQMQTMGNQITLYKDLNLNAKQFRGQSEELIALAEKNLKCAMKNQTIQLEQAKLMDMEIKKLKEIHKLNISIAAAVEKVNKWLAKIPGTGGLQVLLRSFTSLEAFAGGVIGLLVSMISDMNEFNATIYRSYGSTLDLNAAMNDVVVTTGVMKKSAIEAMQALVGAGVRRSSDEMRELTGVIAMYSQATGMGAEGMARFSQQLSQAGSDVKEVDRTIGYFAYAIRNFNMTAQEADQIMGQVAEGSKAIRMAFGDKAKGEIDAYAKSMVAAGAMAKKYGFDAGKAASGVSGSMANMRSMAMMGINAFGRPWSAAMGDFKKNAKQISMSAKAMYEQLANNIGPIEAEKKMQEIHGDSWETYKTLNKAFEDQAKTGKTTEEIMEEFAKQEEAARVQGEYLEQGVNSLNAVFEQGKAALGQFLYPLLWIITGINKAAAAFQEFNKWTNGWAGYILTGAAVLAIGVIAISKTITAIKMFSSEIWSSIKSIGAFGKSILGIFIPSMRGTAKATEEASKASESLNKASGGGFVKNAKRIGRGINEFLREATKGNFIGNAAKFALAMTILLLPIVILGVIAKTLGGIDAAGMAAAGVALVGLGLAMKLCSDSIGKIKLKDVLQGLVVVAIIAAIAVGLAFASKQVDPAGLLAMCAAIFVLVGALLVLAVVGVALAAFQVAIWPVIGILLALAVAMVIVAAATLIFANAFKIMADIPWGSLMKLPVALIALGVALSVAAALMLAASGPFMAASLLTAIGLAALTLASSGIDNIAKIKSEMFAELANGMWALVGSPYIRFVPAAIGVATGLRILLSAVSANVIGLEALSKIKGDGVRALADLVWSIANSSHKAFRNAAYNVAAGLWILNAVGSSAVDGIVKLGGGALTGLASGVNDLAGSMWNNFYDAAAVVSWGLFRIFAVVSDAPIAKLLETSHALSELATSLQKYVGLEAATEAAAQSIAKIARSAESLKSRMGAMTATGSMIIRTLTEPLEKAHQDSKDEKMLVLLKAIKEGVERTNGTIASIGDTINGGKSSEVIVDILKKIYMNVIENRGGMGSQVNNWYQ